MDRNEANTCETAQQYQKRIEERGMGGVCEKQAYLLEPLSKILDRKIEKSRNESEFLQWMKNAIEYRPPSPAVEERLYNLLSAIY